MQNQLFTYNVRDNGHTFKPLKTKVEPKKLVFCGCFSFSQILFSRSLLVFGRVMHVYPFSLSFTLYINLSSSLLAHQTHIASNARICTKNPKNRSNLPPFKKTNNIFPYDSIFNNVPLWFVKINGALATQIITLPQPPLRYSKSSSSHHPWLRCEWQFQQRHGIGRRKVVNPAVSGAGVVWLFFSASARGSFFLLPSLKLTVCTWKWMVGKYNFTFGMVIFSGANCWFQEAHLSVVFGCWKDA